jgi:hypothetical protein
MSVICDLQLNVAGVGSLLTFDFRGPTENRNPSKVVSPLFPFDPDRGALPLQMPRSSATGNLPLTWANISSLNFDTINFLHKLEFVHRFPGDVA